MSDDALKYKIAFAHLGSLRPMLAHDILSRVGDEAAFFSLSSLQLSSVFGRRIRLFDDRLRADALERAKKEMDFVEAHGVKPLYFRDRVYPERLKECDDAPLMLYTLGDCDFDAKITVSIVGTRHATPYGTRFVATLIEDLASRLTCKPLIISGLAHGIDIAAHKAAISFGLPTVAVLAHGLNTIYPAVHRNVASEIARGRGALVTEYRSSDQIHKGNFLSRNRIIAGMSDCVVVAESALKGGALVTARIAQEYNREVFALPGRVGDPYSQGCNRLIAANTASLVCDADQLISAMGWPANPVEGEQQVLPVDLKPDEQLIVEYLQAHGDGRMNKMSVDLNLPVAKLMAALIDLEFKGLVIPFPGGLYRNA